MNSSVSDSRAPIVATLVRRPPPPFDRRLRNRSYHRIMLGLSLAVLAAAFLLQLPGDTQVELPVVGIQLPNICMWRNSLGIDCPGCGLTRSFICLAHADPAAAWRYNPAGILLFAALLAQVPYRGTQLWRLAHGREEWTSRLLNWTIWVVIIAILAQWLIRAALGRIF